MKSRLLAAALAAMLAACLVPASAFAASGDTYVLTANSGGGYNVRNNSSPVGADGQSLSEAVSAIDGDSGGAGGSRTIQFAEGGNTLDIGTDAVILANGSYILTGKLTGASENTGVTDGVVCITTADTVSSSADISNTASPSSIGGSYAVNNSGAATLTITGGAVSAPNGLAYAINNFQNGAVTVSGGSVTAAAGRAIHSQGYNYTKGSISVTGGAISATTGTAIQDYSGGPINVSGGAVTATGAGGKALGSYHGGDINVSGGAMVSASGSGGAAISVNFGGNVSVSGGTVTAAAVVGSARAIENLGGGEVKISGTGSVSSTSGAAIFCNGAVNVTGGTVTTSGSTSADSAIYNNGSGSVSVSGGLVQASYVTLLQCEARAIHNNGGGAVAVSGGAVSAAGSLGRAVWNNSTGSVTVSGGEVSASGVSGNAIRNNSTGSVTVAGGRVAATGGNGFGIVNCSTGGVTVSGGEIAATVGAYSSAIGNLSTGGIAISGGTLSATAFAVFFQEAGGTLSLSQSGAAAPVMRGDVQAYTGPTTGFPAPTVEPGRIAEANTAYDASATFAVYDHACAATYKYVTLAPAVALTGGSASFTRGGAGADAVFTAGGGITGFSATANYDKTVAGGVQLGAPQVAAADGSIILTFAKSYLNTLSVGTHTATVYLKGAGYAGMTLPIVFTVTPAGGSSSGRENPSTGV